MDPQQELFTALKLALESKGFDVYDGVLPPEGTPYPFVYLGDFRQTDTEHKNAVTGTVYPMIHVWHNDIRKRGTVSKMLLEIKTEFRKLVKTSNFAWLVRNLNARIIADNTTKTPLLHGVIEAEFKFS
jgi:hypothetical protein